MKTKKVPLYLYFLILLGIHLLLLLLIDKIYFYGLPWSSSMRINNDYSIDEGNLTDFYIMFKYLYVYYLVSYFYLTLIHSFLLFLIINIKNTLLRIFIYFSLTFVFSVFLYFLNSLFNHRISYYRFFVYYSNALIDYFYLICLFLFVNFVFSLFFSIQSLTINTKK
jgi:hypothetical protein